MKSVVLWVFVLSLAAAAQNSAPHSKMPLILINGNGNITFNSGAIGTRGLAIGQASASKHDQTMEMAEQLLKHCPEVTLTVKADSSPDYALLLNREGGPMGAGESQVMLLRGADETVLFVKKNSTVAKAMKDGCKAVLADWKQGHSSEAANGPWKFTKPETSK